MSAVPSLASTVLTKSEPVLLPNGRVDHIISVGWTSGPPRVKVYRALTNSDRTDKVSTEHWTQVADFWVAESWEKFIPGINPVGDEYYMFKFEELNDVDTADYTVTLRHVDKRGD